MESRIQNVGILNSILLSTFSSMRYFNIWLKLASNSLQETYVNRFSNLLFFVGKILRFGLFLMLLYAFKHNVPLVGNYEGKDLLLFFLVFNWIDTFVQTIFRGVYTFSRKIRTGEFDFELIRPVSPLFKSLFGKPDINDAIFLVPITILSLYLAREQLNTISIENWLLFLILLINSVLIATSFHILVLCLGILTTEVDNAIMLYRDASNFVRFPVDIYHGVLRLILVTIVPVGIMMTVPAQALMGMKTTVALPIACAIGVCFFLLSITAWKHALKHYSSASS